MNNFNPDQNPHILSSPETQAITAPTAST